MIRPTTYILTAIAAILFVACSADDDFGSNNDNGNTVHLEVPISVVTTDGGTRGIGDPGIDEECPPPSHIYLIAWVKTGTDMYALEYLHRTTTTADWQLYDKTSETYARYDLKNHIVLSDLPTPSETAFAKNEQIGRTIVFATSKALDAATLKDILTGIYSDASDFTGNEDKKIYENIPKATGDAFDTKMRNITLDCSTWTTTELRDLYSTPTMYDGRTDVLGIHNGQILYNKDDYPGFTVLHGEIRIYHVAAKFDFKWEVAPELQSTVAIKRITVSKLPTTCRLFRPASNPSTAATSTYIIGGTQAEAEATGIINNGILQPINPGNKWIGREYFYALQPSDSQYGAITYQVDFEDVDNDGTVRPSTPELTFTPNPLNSIFTGWYRINATVK